VKIAIAVLGILLIYLAASGKAASVLAALQSGSAASTPKAVTPSASNSTPQSPAGA
jgi:hypothetical protein